MTNEELLTELKSRFPGIDDPDEEMDGGDTVDALVAWYTQLRQYSYAQYLASVEMASDDEDFPF